MRTMAPLLPNTTLLEYVDQDNIIYRIAGENVTARFGFNPTGANFLELIDASIRSAVSDTTKSCLVQRCGLYAVYESQYESGLKRMNESLMLPIRKTLNGDVAFFLGYHVHHQATDADAPANQTAIGARWVFGDCVDIGFGVPSAAIRHKEPIGRRRA